MSHYQRFGKRWAMRKYINEYINSLKDLKKEYTSVSIYVPKKNGKPCIEKGCRWYVYFYKKTDEGYKQIKIYNGINRYKTIEERFYVAKSIQKAIEKFLLEGGDPFAFTNQNLSVLEAINLAFERKSNEWSSSTLYTNKSYLKKFIEWLINNKIDKYTIKNQFKKHHLIAYIEYLKKNLNPTSVNNNIRFLKNIFGKLSEDDITLYNYASDLRNIKEKPNKNTPFTNEQYEKIISWLKKNDPYLLFFIRFMSYTFLRPIEVLRIRTGNINMKERIIEVPTKTEQISRILIIEKLFILLKEIELEKYPQDFYLFTPTGKPGKWEKRNFDTSGYQFFRRRFKKVKNILNLGNEYGLYSFRHTFARNIYFKLLAEGMTDLEAKYKLMTITRHKSLSSLNKYLRSIGAILPDDYSGYID